MAVASRVIRKIELAQEILNLAHQEKWEAGRHVTEAELCAALGVSRSPVRAALGVLRDWGSVSHRSRRGHFLRFDAEELLGAWRDLPASTEEDLMFRILRARLSGELAATITQVDVAERFGVPRTLAASVLARMTSEGLVERRKGRGWRFLPEFESAASRRRGYEFRLLIEPAALLLPSFEIDRPALDRLHLVHREVLERTDRRLSVPSGIYRIDASFHETLAGFSGNAFVRQSVQTQNRLRRFFEHHGYRNPRRTEDWCGEHLAVIEALRVGRLKEASAALRRHLQNAAAVEPGEGQ